MARASLFSAAVVEHTGFSCHRSLPVTKNSGKADRARRDVSCFFPLLPPGQQILRSSERARLGSARGRWEKPRECLPQRSKRGLDLGKRGQNEQWPERGCLILKGNRFRIPWRMGEKAVTHHVKQKRQGGSVCRVSGVDSDEVLRTKTQ